MSLDLTRLGYDLIHRDGIVPARRTGNGRYLQLSVRLQGSREGSLHDKWFVVQITEQTHRGEVFVPQSNTWIFDKCERGKEVRLVSHSSGHGLGSPRIFSNPEDRKVPYTFTTRNAMGRLDDMPMIIDYQEMDAIAAAVVAYNETFGNTGRRDRIVGGMEIIN